jgi:cell division protein FtsW (lipid II flippase)
MKYFNSERQRIYYLLALSLNLFLIISTGSVGAYLTLAINLLIAFMLIGIKKKWRILYFPVIIFAAYNLLQKMNLFDKLEIDYILRKITRHSMSFDLIPADRVNIILSYFSIFKDNLLGVGAGQATVIGKANYGISINPHSLLVEVAVEYGMIGLMIILSLYFIYLYRLIRVMTVKDDSLDFNILKKTVFINYITMFLWTNVPSRILNGFDIFWIFIGLIILMLYKSKNLNEGVI